MNWYFLCMLIYVCPFNLYFPHHFKNTIQYHTGFYIFIFFRGMRKKNLFKLKLYLSLSIYFISFLIFQVYTSGSTLQFLYTYQTGMN